MTGTSAHYGKQWVKKINSKVTGCSETSQPIPRHLALHWDSKSFTEIHQNIAQQIWIQFAHTKNEIL